MNAQKKIQSAFEAGKAYILANRHEHNIGIIASQPLPKKRFGKRMSKAEKFELLHFATQMRVRETRTRFEEALSKLNKEDAAVLATKLQEARI